MSGNWLRLAGDDAERVSLCQVLSGRVALLAGGLGLGVQRGYGSGLVLWENGLTSAAMAPLARAKAERVATRMEVRILREVVLVC